MDSAHEAGTPQKESGTGLEMKIAEAGWLALIVGMALFFISCAFADLWIAPALDVLWVASSVFAVIALTSRWVRAKMAGCGEWLAGCARRGPPADLERRAAPEPKFTRQGGRAEPRPVQSAQQTGPEPAPPPVEAPLARRLDAARRVRGRLGSPPASSGQRHRPDRAAVRFWRTRQIKRKLAKTPAERLAQWSLTAGVFGCIFFCAARFFCDMAMKTREWSSGPLATACVVGVVCSLGLVGLSAVLRIVGRTKSRIDRRRRAARGKRAGTAARR